MKLHHAPSSTALAIVGLVAAALLAAGCGATSAGAQRPVVANPLASGATTIAQNWTVYHRSISGEGAAPAGLDLAHMASKWTSKVLDGNLYSEPLVWDQHIYIATENDTVYALSPTTGSVIWAHHLATAVPSSKLPCGNINPTVGITSTPVVDAARQEIYVVDDELANGAVHHELVGLNALTGKVLLRQNVDPAGASTTAILQRASLTLDNGRIVFAYGGNYGDCSTYHGWVVSVPATGGTARYYKVDAGPGESRGSIWMGGAAPVIDGKGNIWIATGNGSVTSSSGPYDYSDSVLQLSPALKVLQHFAPSTWYSDNASDSDLGSSVPAVLPNGLVVQAGKSQTAYLLNRSNLGGIGHSLHTLTGICGDDVDGGIAYSGNTVYLPCRRGVIAVQTDPTHKTFHELWQSSTGSGGPPILAGGLVWTIDSNGQLYGLSPSTGHAVQTLSVGSNASSFPTPSVGDGLLLATSAQQVHAYIHH